MNLLRKSRFLNKLRFSFEIWDFERQLSAFGGDVSAGLPKLHIHVQMDSLKKKLFELVFFKKNWKLSEILVAVWRKNLSRNFETEFYKNRGNFEQKYLEKSFHVFVIIYGNGPKILPLSRKISSRIVETEINTSRGNF